MPLSEYDAVPPTEWSIKENDAGDPTALMTESYVESPSGERYRCLGAPLPPGWVMVALDARTYPESVSHARVIVGRDGVVRGHEFEPYTIGDAVPIVVPRFDDLVEDVFRDRMTRLADAVEVALTLAGRRVIRL